MADGWLPTVEVLAPGVKPKYRVLFGSIRATPIKRQMLIFSSTGRSRRTY
jgi:hypothetical protein